MTTQKFSNGCFCFYRNSACQPMTPHAIEMLVQKHHLPSTMVPEYAGDRTIVARSIAHVQPKASREHWLLRPIRQTSTEIVYGIVHEEKNTAHETLAYQDEARLRWTSDNGNGIAVSGAHSVAMMVDAQYQAWRGLIMAQDWALAMTNYLTQTCQGQAMRDDGRIYWIPPQTLQYVHALSAFLADVGIHLVVCEVESEHTPIVQQAASEGIAEQLATLEQEVNAFDGKQKPSTYKSRIQEYETLRKRAMTYRDALGIGVDHAQAMLDTLEQKVQDLLSLRETTIVHRDGTEGKRGTKRAKKETISVETTPMTEEHASGYAPVIGEFHGIPVAQIPEGQQETTPSIQTLGRSISIPSTW